MNALVRTRVVGLFALLGLVVWLPHTAGAAAIVSGFNTSTLAPNDDGSTAQVPLGFEVDLFGTRSNAVYVNNNGNVTFDARLSTYTPFNLLSTNQLVIAPFFADVDTSRAGLPVTYGTGTFEGRPAFGVNWIDVDYFSSNTAHQRRNSFQLILVGRADRGSGDFDIVFNYDRIQWEAGTASGGSADGLGGSSARAGYAIGRGAPGSAFELAGSAINGALLDGGNNSLVRGSRGSTVPGRYVFEIRADQSAQISALTPFANAASIAAMSDASGRYVVFQSLASNLVSDGDPNPGSDIFRIDTLTGEILRISRDNAGAPISGDATGAAISGDGSLVYFIAPDRAVQQLLGESAEKRAQRLKADGNGVFLRILLTGTTGTTGTTQRIGQGSPGGEQPRPSASGSHVIFTGSNSDPTAGVVGQENIYLVPTIRNGDVVTAGVPRCVSCKSVAANGSDSTSNSDGDASNPVVSADGSVVAWETRAKNSLAGSTPPCPNAGSSVIVRNMLTGTAMRASAPATGGNCGASGSGSAAPQIDDDGSMVVFESTQPLTAGDGNAVSDAFLFTVQGASTERVSVSATGGEGNGGSFAPTLSGDGNIVAFVSSASNLDPTSTDSNGVADVHVKALATDALARLSSTDTGQQANGASARPGLNYDGSRIVFDSSAGNLAPGSVTGLSVVYQRANPLVSGLLRSATWWNSSESGWGLFIFDQGNVLAPAWFTYDNDGEPTWFLAAGAFLQGDGSYRGDLYRFTGVPFAQISGTAADPATLIGNMVLRFSGDSALQFQYTVGSVTQTKNMTRFPFGTSALACRASPTSSRATASNYSDVWYNPASSGWGLFLNHVDNGLFAVWYTYDNDREAVFYVVVTQRQADGSFAGEVYRQRNGTPFAQISGQPPSAGADIVGSARFTFQNGEAGTFQYTVGSVTQSKSIVRLQVGSLASVCDSVPSMAR